MSSDSESDLDREPTGDRADGGAESAPEIEDGRYVYCVIRIDDKTGSVPAFEAIGVADEPVFAIVSDGLGAIVHECDRLYDSGDPLQIRRWLVRHQSVVDEAGQAFGTPLPFQFDTIVRGGDEAVREWLEAERETLGRFLDSLAGHWEYRIDVRRTQPIDEATLVAADERLRELRDEIDDSSEGTAFLLEKRYDTRIEELRSARRAALADDLRDRLDERAREVHELDRSPAASIGGESTGAGDESGGETICRFTVLAHEESEDAVGSVLDDVASEPGIEVRYTGPWPPYTFTPAFGDESEGGGETERADARSGTDR